jgi:DNA helicase-2/ATP-dependent DNA helicase PcrA
MDNGLTTPQRAAVEHFTGPLLIIAGPGSGKTRVITRRIARLVERGVDPRAILAITFTNRAAREMQHRVDALLPGARVWVSTFHRFCASVLRRRADVVGLDSNFTIFDKADQLQVIRHVLKELDMDAVRAQPSKISARISRIKNSFTEPDEFVRTLECRIGEPFDTLVAQVYPLYQSALLESNAVDFDDLLLHVVRLFADNPELRADYDMRYQFLLVDEYQDTNPAQYQLVRSLSVNVPNVCVTGDPDQSIYAWRGATIENILNFERDYPNAQLIRLEQNFRSTGLILRAADRLIAHNRQRKAKSLITDAQDGHAPRLLTFPDGRTEATGIADQVRTLREETGLRWSEIAVFYRVNSMSRELELGFARQRIPFQVAAGLAFYDRAEIKDLIAYLRVIDNPADQIAFLRIVNRPARGIGGKTQTHLQRWANERRVNLLEAARSADQIDGISKTARPKLKMFARMMEGLTLADYGNVSGLLTGIVNKTFFHRTWANVASEQAIEKEANVTELINAAAQYDELDEDDPSVTGFLETTALVNDGDLLDPSAGKVTLMTMHAAKGLEFPCVFVVGLEHGLIPHERAVKSDDPKQIEEERRLLFVGMTRAMQRLYLTTAQVRSVRGKPQLTIPSQFLVETEFESEDGVGFEPDDAQASPKRSAFTEKDLELRKRLKESLGSAERPLLTTGAGLLNGTHDAADLPQLFAIGMRVRHPQYGVGAVTNVTGFGRRKSVTVAFQEPSESHTFDAARCPLQPVGMR